MNEIETLQYYTLEQFNKLMYRFSKVSPEWANHIKMNLNKKTNNVYESKAINPWLWHEGFKGKIKSHDLSNPACCIVGETYDNTSLYIEFDEGDENEEYCNSCSNYSTELFNLRDKTDDKIVNLTSLEYYISHIEEDHPDLLKEENVK